MQLDIGFEFHDSLFGVTNSLLSGLKAKMREKVTKPTEYLVAISNISDSECEIKVFSMDMNNYKFNLISNAKEVEPFTCSLVQKQQKLLLLTIGSFIHVFQLPSLEKLLVIESKPKIVYMTLWKERYLVIAGDFFIQVRDFYEKSKVIFTQDFLLSKIKPSCIFLDEESNTLVYSDGYYILNFDLASREFKASNIDSFLVDGMLKLDSKTFATLVQEPDIIYRGNRIAFYDIESGKLLHETLKLYCQQFVYSEKLNALIGFGVKNFILIYLGEKHSVEKIREIPYNPKFKPIDSGVLLDNGERYMCFNMHNKLCLMDFRTGKCLHEHDIGFAYKRNIETV